MTTLYATPIPTAYAVQDYGKLGGANYITLRVCPNDYDACKSLPTVLAFQGASYVRTGWNSDTGEVTYKDRPYAEAM